MPMDDPPDWIDEEYERDNNPGVPDGRVEQVVSGHHSYVSGEREGPIR